MKIKSATSPAEQDGVDVGRRHALKLAGLGVTTLGMMPFVNIPFAKAQDMSNGANNFYTSDKVNLQKVTFKNQYQMNVAGNLFTPKTLNRNAKAPAVIVGHPMGAVKEQSANLYATMMAERGFVALSLDLPFWGESEGQPRNARVAGHLCRGLQRRGRLSSARSPSSTGTASVRSASAAAEASSSAPPRSIPA